MGMQIRTSRPVRVGEAIERLDNGLSVGHYNGYTLYSAYQPIFRFEDAETLRVAGLEGLIRPFVDDVSITPSLLFRQIGPEDALFIECICQALHIRNFQSATPINCDLYINVNLARYTDIESMEKEFLFMLSRLAINGLSRSTIVLEFLETVPASEKILLWLRDFAKAQHVRIAMDDYGRGESNLERYHSLMPDVVKIDGHLFAQSMVQTRQKRLLDSFISRAHDDGGRVIIEGIETSDMFVFARELGADLFQGFYLDKPHIPSHDFLQSSRPNLSQALH